MTSHNDIFLVYNQMVEYFYELFPDKKNSITISNDDIVNYVNRFCLKFKINDNQQYFSLLTRRQGKLFKALKVTLLPQLKMEVILNITINTTEEQKDIMDNIWSNIWLLYILGESLQQVPNTTNINHITQLLEHKNSSNNVTTQLPSTNEMQTIMNNFDSDKMKSLMGNLDLNNMKSLMGNVDMKQMKSLMGNLDMSNMQSVMQSVDMNQIQTITNSNEFKNILSQIQQEPTDKGKAFIKNILTDFKQNFKQDPSKLNEKVNSKEFVSQLINVGSSIGNTYSDKINSGELEITDIIGAISNLAINPDDSMIKELVQGININNIDIKEVISELKDKFKDNIPDEIMSLISSFDLDQLKNMDISSLLGNVLGGETKEPEIVELTPEQKKELLEYYDKAKI